jgi:hypothetical protein
LTGYQEKVIEAPGRRWLAMSIPGSSGHTKQELLERSSKKKKQEEFGHKKTN